MRAFFNDRFALELPDGHKFPMRKYTRLRERIAAELPQIALGEPAGATDAQLGTCHAADYLQRVVEGRLDPKEVRRIGFPWSERLVERSRRSTGATIAAADAALEDGVGANLAGGTHHAFADRGEGFCVFNDAGVAARTLQTEGRIARAVVIDCDVHQGNGTARIFEDDDSVFTFSIHGRDNFPYRKEVSDLDIELPDKTDDATYLEELNRGLEIVEGVDADIVFYLAGADPFYKDKFGRLGLTKTGLAERDRQVFGLCATKGWPVAVSMAGGYAPDVEDIVDIHFETIRQASNQAAAWQRVAS